MLLAALLLYANVRPQRIPRVKQMWTEVGAQAPAVEKSFLECFLHVQHGWPFVFHATQERLEDRSIPTRSYNPDHDERYMSDVPRSGKEMDALRTTGWGGAWPAFTWKQRYDLHNSKAAFAGYGTHLWNANNLGADLILAALVLFSVALAFEHFVARRTAKRNGTNAIEETAVSSGRGPGMY